METNQKNFRESFVLADMHSDGVYFDQTILKAQKEIVQDSNDRPSV
ncbi:hypothetical protein G3I01_16045 [Gramella sp. MT6]|nr:hypothetical protein [Gramella sp. MT6]QYA26941.1 hypothetical protein G3I01_16045 [Gramella sp. MT6]